MVIEENNLNPKKNVHQVYVKKSNILTSKPDNNAVLFSKVAEQKEEQFPNSGEDDLCNSPMNIKSKFTSHDRKVASSFTQNTVMFQEDVGRYSPSRIDAEDSLLSEIKSDYKTKQ